MSNSAKREELIERMVVWMIDDGAPLELNITDLPRRANWSVKVDINNVGKLVGKLASHLDAYKVLVSIMGRCYGEEWIFDVVPPDDAKRVEQTRRPLDDDFDPAPISAFLTEVLSAFCEDAPTIRYERGPGSHEYTFTIEPKHERDYKRLATAVPIMKRYPVTAIAAVGTLFRAYGRKLGGIVAVKLPPQ